MQNPNFNAVGKRIRGCAVRTRDGYVPDKSQGTYRGCDKHTLACRDEVIHFYESDHFDIVVADNDIPTVNYLTGKVE